MHGAVPWLIVTMVAGGAAGAAAGQEPSAADRAAAERTLAAMRDLGAAWLSWLAEVMTVEDFSHTEWLERPAGARPPAALAGMPGPEDREAFDAWLAEQIAAMQAEQAWQASRRYRVEWPHYYDLRKVPLRLTAAELEALLRELLPAEEVDGLAWEDGWGRPFELRFSGWVLAPQVMAIRSGGRDGEAEGTMYRIGAVPPDPDADLVWADGFFLRWPEGVELGD